MIPEPLAGALKALARREGVTMAMVLLAAYQTLLARYSGQDDIVLGSPVANRRDANVEGLIGFFVNSLVLRGDLSGNPSFVELLRRVRTTSLEAYDHQDLPFEKVVEALDPERDLSRPPLFQAVFAMQNVPDAKMEIPGLTIRGTESGLTTMRFELELYLAETGEGLSGSLWYNTELFDPSTADRIVEHYRFLLQGIADDPEMRLSDLPLLTDAQRRTLLVDWNDTKAAYPRDVCVHELFEAEVRRAPEAVAVQFGDRRLSYGELNRRANRVAHDLRNRGARPGALVGICMERGLDFVVGLLGILKSGAAYVPMDAEYPAPRLSLMLADARPLAVLTHRDVLSRLPAREGTIVCLDEIDWETPGARDTDPPSLTGPGDLAYVMFTSGSTGKPKGACVAHRGIVRLVRGVDYVRFAPTDHVAQASSASFDAATFEIWGALLNGARLCVVPKQVLLSPPSLAALIRDERITIILVTTALFNQISIEAPGLFAPIEQLLVGGEAADRGAVRAVLQHGPPGTASATPMAPPSRPRSIATGSRTGGPERRADRADRAADGHQAVPCGRRAREPPVPRGSVEGELQIGGDGLATGYLDDPELTAARSCRPVPHRSRRSALPHRRHRAAAHRRFDRVRRSPRPPGEAAWVPHRAR